MSSTTDLIAELFRAANQIGTLTSFERVRLIERAAATIQGQRDLLATKERVVPLTYDVTANLEKMKAQAPEMPEVLSAVVMLKCADEIRRLRILLETDQR
ncbi:MAG: hypothetical protein ABS35_43910 [Kaistia sp. SCN 65-12]|nr:MAG: hypothetical protein ABS35_43910 [Kaistia sp. SCN 65-12]